MPKLSTEDFLKLMSQLESSGGKQLNHPAATKGLSTGDHAVGQYGLMPQTAYEVLHPSDPRKMQTDPNLWQFNNMNPKELSNKIKNSPELEHSIAAQYADKVLNRAQSPEAASEMWLMGASHPVSNDELQNNPRVLKFQQLRDALQNSSAPTRLPASVDDSDEEQ